MTVLMSMVGWLACSVLRPVDVLFLTCTMVTHHSSVLLLASNFSNCILYIVYTILNGKIWISCAMNILIIWRFCNIQSTYYCTEDIWGFNFFDKDTNISSTYYPVYRCCSGLCLELNLNVICLWWGTINCASSSMLTF